MSAVDPDLDFIRWMKRRFSLPGRVGGLRGHGTYGRCRCGTDECGLERCRFLVFIMEISAHTAEGNVCHGDVINHKTENSYVYAESGLVTTVGAAKIWW
ncbi:hypothetical protein ACLB1N_12825 [Escherichia coli]